MTVPRWNPPKELSRREQMLLKRRTKKLFGFLRQYRHELFDEAFQQELAAMYRETGEGKAPVAPALLAMVTLLQAYTGASDAEAVDLSMDNARWQMVLGRSEEHTSELQSRLHLVCRLLLEKKKKCYTNQ